MKVEVKSTSRIDRKQNQVIFVIIVIALITLGAMLWHVNDLNARLLILENTQKEHRIQYGRKFYQTCTCCYCELPIQKERSRSNQSN